VWSKICCNTPSPDSSPYPCPSISRVCASCNQRARLGTCTYRQPPLAAVISYSCHPISHAFSLASLLLQSTHYLARTGLLERHAKTAHGMTDLGQVTKASKCTAPYLHVAYHRAIPRPYNAVPTISYANDVAPPCPKHRAEIASPNQTARILGPPRIPSQ
jgi:hypothetical protein